MDRVQIGKRWVGAGEPVYIIAEAGSNHDGKLSQARALIDVAAEARADAVKFQLFRADALYPRSAGASDYLPTPRSIHEIIRDAEMPEAWLPELAKHARSRGLDFLCTPFDEAAADRMFDHVPAYKIASYEMTHHPLLAHVASKRKPVILSTGTATLDEVGEAVEVVRAAGNEQLILLQCTASYPAPLRTLNLRVIPVLRERFGVPAGLSDHSSETSIGAVAAVALGAAVIEKHFTLDRKLPGPDHAYAIEPGDLAAMVSAVRDTERALGSGVKEPPAEEEALRAFARRTIFTTRAIRAGDALTRENVAVLRSGKLGYGLHPREYPRLLGRRAKRALDAETLVRIEDLA